MLFHNLEDSTRTLPARSRAPFSTRSASDLQLATSRPCIYGHGHLSVEEDQRKLEAPNEQRATNFDVSLGRTCRCKSENISTAKKLHVVFTLAFCFLYVIFTSIVYTMIHEAMPPNLAIRDSLLHSDSHPLSLVLRYRWCFRGHFRLVWKASNIHNRLLLLQSLFITVCGNEEHPDDSNYKPSMA